MDSFLTLYPPPLLLCIVLSIFLLGMSKGGFPVGAVALPAMVLIWPGQAGGAKQVIAFMLPILCVMDLFAVRFYWRHIRWERITPLLPATLLGVALASVLFLFGDKTMLSLSDRWLKFMIGLIGILFVLYQATRRLILHTLQNRSPGWKTASGFGLLAGVTSTLAHAGGPVAQMYLLPQNLGKMQFAATAAGFFFLLNLVKLLPYAASGQFSGSILLLATVMLPVVPLGVGAGYLAVKMMRGDAYRIFIHAILLFTSVLLLGKALTG